VTQVPGSETQGGEQPEAAPRVASSQVSVIAVYLGALAVIGAATANFLPSFGSFPLPDFNRFSLPSVERFSLPDFSRFSPPNSNRVAALPPPSPAPVLVPDPVVRAGLRDIQTSQEQNADVAMSLIQSSAAQQADLKRITRQLALLTAQVSSLQNQVTSPLTTSSILPSPTSSIPRPNARTRVVQSSRRVVPPVAPAPLAVLPATPPSLPKPVGPFSVGGAPLSPAPAPGSGAS
jgi:hypothetical protein